jgi:hypothetical protein
VPKGIDGGAALEPLLRLALSLPTRWPLLEMERRVRLSKTAAALGPGGAPGRGGAPRAGRGPSSRRSRPSAIFGSVVDRLPRRRVVGHVVPMAAGAHDPLEPVEDLARVVAALRGVEADQGEVGDDEGPLLVGYVGGVGLSTRRTGMLTSPARRFITRSSNLIR